MHLARTVAHTVDVDAMLEGMEPWQFEEWVALYVMKPWGDDWEQAGTIASQIRNETTRSIYMTSGGDKPTEDDYTTAEDFMPVKKKKKTRKSSKMNTDEAITYFRSRIGV